MKGMNANTGRSISGVDHLSQSIGRILGTPLGSCIQRRSFGSEVPDLIDAPTNGATQIRLYAAIATALMRWEPRLTLTRVQLAEDADAAFAGRQLVDIEGWTDERDEPVSLRVPVSNGGGA
ncbi:GPW/gp25 family protein [Burkholderia ubonensis]|uniref:GPW/gp25 family protein n=1 Tax=Burkholderia ubonensis TaxID=101571 RepID=UPI0007535B47|nr:GPW/gp25 family protein [Burkholderia ubonensis]KVC82463.1 baseplate assembly protein [Burkholderia ubonensis]KVX12189.1 baseplate assembly protein [Burkholderia ubonensis]KWO79196.1 baseplate assembly protein [Burkholderia ubonensis]